MATNKRRRKYPGWCRRHEGVLLFLLSNPSANLEECAKAVGYSKWHLSRIINSPEFMQRFSESINKERQKAAARLLAPKSTR